MGAYNWSFVVWDEQAKSKNGTSAVNCQGVGVKVRWLNEKRVFATQRKEEEEEKRMNVKVVIKYYLSVLRKSAIY